MARKALITAGAGGIGAAIALRAKADGYDVTISDIDDAAGEKLASEHGLTYIRCDLGDEAQVVALIKKVGRVDLLVNNCRISGLTAPIENWRQPTGTRSWRSTSRRLSSPAAKWCG
jgi:NAD(P)-dependent dehydrogenase (short-subunit alcohol dehydrogenase family)